MLVPEIQSIGADDPTAQLEDGELLVVVGPAPGAVEKAGERAGWVRKLAAAAQPSMGRAYYHMSYAVGFLPNAHKTPYVVVDWQKAGANALERRWLFGKVAGLLQTMSFRKLAVWLEAGSGAEQLAMVEDLVTRQMGPRYDKCQLAGARVLAAPADAARLKEADPFRAARAKAQLTFRSWVNENPDELTSIAIGERLAAFCAQHGCQLETLAEDKLKSLGMNLLLAVGQASTLSPSRLHIATHNLKPGVKPLLLIGKGVTFDTGGINLKPHESFVNCMKNDMGGAGLMANLFMALVESGYPGPLAVAIPCCENLIGEKAMKPGAIIKSYAGKDVIIEHTDAEGRLILADALAYTQKKLDPALTVIGATLTTASLRQFTNFFTAVHFASPAFQAGLTASGKAWGEEFSFWGEFLPFLQGNKSNAADLTNMGRMPSHASMGGACNVAAHFLREFATQPLVHVDIFASTWNWSGDYPGAHYGATGAPLNSLFDWLRRGAV